MDKIDGFKYFGREEIAEALAIIVNVKSPNLNVEIHNISENDIAKSICFNKYDDGTISIFVHDDTIDSVDEYSYDLADVKGHELEVATRIEELPFNYEFDEFFDDERVCDITQDGNEIKVEAYGISPIEDEDIEMLSEQFHAQMPDKIMLKTLKCVPYPGDGANSITLDRARKVKMREILLLAKQILSDAEEEGTLSECHCADELVVEEIAISDNGLVHVILGS